MLLADIPSRLHGRKESYYHSMFLVWMRMIGFDTQSEVQTNIGSIDAVLNHADLTVVAEIKYSPTKDVVKLLETAMKQIQDRKYYEKYADRKVILMGVAFAGKEVKCKLIRN
jgi:hypothetical protein